MHWQKIKLVAFVAVSCFLLLHTYKPSSSSGPNLRSPTFSTVSLSFFQLGSATASKDSSARKCAQPTDIPDNYFMAQFQEDRKLMKWFGGLCGGTYLELGGMDGVTFSNTYVFNKALGWKGVIIELRKDLFAKMVTNRPDELALINAGVCDKPQTLHAVYSDHPAVGGIYEFAISKSFKEQWWRGIELGDDPRVQAIECETLDNLLLTNAPEAIYFDFLSIDVVGADLAALRSIDFGRTQFGVILVASDEYNEMKNMAMRQFLLTKGYSFIFDFEHSYWFANLNFNEIYKDLI